MTVVTDTKVYLNCDFYFEFLFCTAYFFILVILILHDKYNIFFVNRHNFSSVIRALYLCIKEFIPK